MNKLTSKIDFFKKDRGIDHVIAFSGSSIGNNNELLIQNVIEEIIASFKNKLIGILTGGTTFGVSNHAIVIAKQYKLPTIGIFPSIGAKYALDRKFLDLPIEVPPILEKSQWGDESSIFAKTLDSMIIIGGGFGTLIEVSHVLKINEYRNKKGLALKRIIPIIDFKGVSQQLPLLDINTDIQDKCIFQLSGTQLQEINNIINI